jgi:GTP-binding protein LepA
MHDRKLIRNFSIIAHIDHGKSTLADRILEVTGAVSSREMREQFLDNMDLERERGITIKSQTVRVSFTAQDGRTFLYNLIDTPGHVDFSYEVSRALAACEGALLVVDASQGVEAQTYANVYLALDNDLEILPVINKVDLPGADVEGTLKQISDGIGLDVSQAVQVSAKRGLGVPELLERIAQVIPPPPDRTAEALRALIFDAWYDAYRGVVVLVRMYDGEIRAGQRIRMMATGREFLVDEVGVIDPRPRAVESLASGDVGYIIANVKVLTDARVGDTVTDARVPALEALPGFKQMRPMVYAGIYPSQDAEFENLREAMQKLSLNDSSFTWEPETSKALGFGFRCGFLGLLHMEIFQERLEREFDMDLVVTAPTVVYRVLRKDGEELMVDNPALLPEPNHIDEIQEPMVRLTIHVPAEYVGDVLALCQERRSGTPDLKFLSEKRAMITARTPLSEVITDFFDRLKSITRGYGSMDYEFDGFDTQDLVRLDILVNGDPIDNLSVIVHKSRAYTRGRDLTTRLRKAIPRQMYEVAIQAAVGSRIIARETVKAFRKDVIAKCYGGDISRKRKLLEKQKEGKKRMKRLGNVEIPQEAFLAVLKTGEPE